MFQFIRFIWDMTITTIFNVGCVILVGVVSYYAANFERCLFDTFQRGIQDRRVDQDNQIAREVMTAIQNRRQ